MTPTSDLTTFGDDLGSARDQLGQLRTVVDAESALADGVVVPQLVTDAVDDVIGWLDSTAERVRAAQGQAQTDPLATLATLGACHRLCSELNCRFVTGLGGVDSIATLRQLATDRPRHWGAWANQVESMIADLWKPLWILQDDMRACWEEFAARLIGEPLLVRATMTGAGFPAAAESPADQVGGD